MKKLFFVKIKSLNAFIWHQKNIESSYINAKEIKEIKIFRYKNLKTGQAQTCYGVYIYGEELPYKISKKDYERLVKL